MTGGARVSEADFQRQSRDLWDATPVPRIGMLGKTGSGKTSIVRALTGAERAEIGQGFRPQTRLTSRYDFPSSENPLVSFLDTRGLGEAGYDPAADLADFSQQTHLIIVTVRAMDHAISEVLEPLQAIRREAPERPVLLALTALHDADPRAQHPDPDPFGTEPRPLPESISESLRRSLNHHYEVFDGLFDVAVPIDLTQPDDGYENTNFGLSRLQQAVLDLLPAAYRQTLLQLEAARHGTEDWRHRPTLPMILAHSTLAGTAAAVPVPWIDIPFVLAVQTHLAYRLANKYGQPLDQGTVARVSSALGGRIALRMAVREVLKVIPWVGMAASAALGFSFTFAAGLAWDWYFEQVRRDRVPTADELREVFQQELARGAALWRATREPDSDASLRTDEQQSP